MKKTVKKILLVTGIIVLLLVVMGVGFMLKMKSQLKTMHSMETKEIVNGIYSIKDSYVNLFIIRDSSRYIAVDAASNTEVVLGELKKLNIDPDKVIAVLLSHTDGDHVGALKLFKNAKVYLSKKEKQMINGEKSRFFIFGNKIVATEYTLLEDQQEIQIGNLKIKGILTPGHSPGSMCYLVDNTFLFTGDALGLKDGKVGIFNEFFNMDTQTATQSIELITHIPGAEYIFTAHYGYSDDYKNAVKDWK